MSSKSITLVARKDPNFEPTKKFPSMKHFTFENRSSAVSGGFYINSEDSELLEINLLIRKGE